jgi:hypothetical protein
LLLGLYTIIKGFVLKQKATLELPPYKEVRKRHFYKTSKAVREKQKFADIFEDDSVGDLSEVANERATQEQWSCS